MPADYHFDMKPMQDGQGFFYGRFDAGDESFRIDILPPSSHPRPYYVTPNPAADPEMWTIFINGEEIARIKRREDVPRLLVTRLLENAGVK